LQQKDKVIGQMQGLLALGWPCKPRTGGYCQRRDVEKRERMMRSTILRCAAGLALLTGSLASNAQSDTSLAIRVPFDFMVGTTMFPAGEYTVRPVANETFVLAARHGSEFVVMKTRPVLMRSNFRAGGLLFVNDGHHYRLQQVKTRAHGGERLALRPHAGKPVWVAAAISPDTHPRVIRTGKEY
jgi:hypothetical protein